MAKRLAEEPLEDVVARDSPASKKARVDDFPERSNQSKDSTPPPPRLSFTNGLKHVGGERSEHGILKAAIDKNGEEQEEAVSSAESNEIQEEQSAYSASTRQTAPLDGYTDLYLDTIDRSVLDFDFEKLCSVTLSNINVYACLVCGKYYQGRGPKSHAYFHALEVGHHVYVNMQSKRVYVLPEGYEVKSKSLEDIKFVVDPKLSKDEVSRLDKEPKDALDLSGKKYRPGMTYSSARFDLANVSCRFCGNE